MECFIFGQVLVESETRQMLPNAAILAGHNACTVILTIVMISWDPSGQSKDTTYEILAVDTTPGTVKHPACFLIQLFQSLPTFLHLGFEVPFG